MIGELLDLYISLLKVHNTDLHHYFNMCHESLLKK